MTNHDPVAFEAAAREVGFLGFGFYPRLGFAHVGLGPTRQWGERVAERGLAHGTRVMTRTMGIGGLALAPVHQQAAANARRLR